MSARGVFAVIVVTGGTACLAIPPSRSSYGPALTHHGPGYRASIGAHSVAADTRDAADVDLGAGWVTEGGSGRVPVHGTYIALARRLPWVDRRIWLGGRAEMFWRVDPGAPRQALVARAAYRRRIGSVAGASHGGGAVGAYGAFAFGLHLDLGARSLDGGGGEVFVAMGASIDLPFLLGASKPGPMF